MYPIWCFVVISIILLYIVKSRTSTLQEEFINLTSNQALKREMNRVKSLTKDEPLFKNYQYVYS